MIAESSLVSNVSCESMVGNNFNSSILPVQEAGALRPIVAIVTDDRECQLILRQKLDLLGYASVAFGDYQALLDAIDHALRIELVLLKFTSTTPASQLSALPRAHIKLPLILVIPPLENDPDWLPLKQSLFMKDDVIDFIVLSASNWEFESRMRALLDRFKWRNSKLVDCTNPANLQGADCVFGRYTFKIKSKKIILMDDHKIVLKPREFEVALLFFCNEGQLLTRSWIWSNMLSENKRNPRSRSLDVCVSGIRKKMHLHEKNGFILNSIYGQGYMLFCIDSSMQKDLNN
jgi:DNA-binding winged helix-turn-helix (wHTH) protein